MFVMEQITKSIETRIENMEDNKKRMLDSILERERKSINIDRLIVKKDNKLELILEKEEILRETNKHFRGITDSVVEQNEELENYWKNEYTPREDIDGHIYKSLLEDIGEEEWLDNLRGLSRGKAGGLSKITYEILKESNGEMKELLRNFFNECIRAELMPIDWSKGVIYPIPKPGDWNLNLDKTRPITLLECPRKFFMKILTNRLTKIFTEYWDILGDNNFAALPGKSTNEPLHILNNVMEEARENKKELWILLQDMSKAYDLVHREHLWKAMQRLKIPEQFINIIKNSLKYRTNRVITDLGLTEEYNMKNGIDQGETMSPILWVIYYDPVFSKIKKQKGIGYRMKHEWKKDINLDNKSKIGIEIHNIAFMDDTTWLGKGKRELEEQLNIADSFRSEEHTSELQS